MSVPRDNKPIIFFDGFCGLCSDFVDFTMKIDKKGVHMFSPLQGETAKELLNIQEREDLDSMVLFQNGQKFKRSAAVFQVWRNTGGVWKVLTIFEILPRSITDFAYNLVAKYRYALFGKKDFCRMPTPLERKRFLD